MFICSRLGRHSFVSSLFSQSMQDEESENVAKTPVDIVLEEPASPASSVISNETDSGSTRGKGRRSSRGGKGGNKPGRRSTRVTRSKPSVVSCTE